MTETTIRDSFGHPLHRWTNSTGDEWACCEYDHGPFCRRCVPVTEMTALLLDQMLPEGLVELVGPNPADQSPDLRFRLTEKGEAAAQELIEHNPEGFALYMRAMTGMDTPPPPGTPEAGGER